eukprot:333234_1
MQTKYKVYRRPKDDTSDEDETNEKKQEASPNCICAEIMQKYKSSEVYPPPLQPQCDICSKTIEGNLYHCPDGKNISHIGGYDICLECSNSMEIHSTDTSTFINHMDFKDAEQLKPNDKIDHRHSLGCFFPAIILEKNGTNLKIHYEELSAEYDIISDYQTEIYKFAVLHSISKRCVHRMKRLKVFDFIKVNFHHMYPKHGWKICQILAIDSNSAQVRVQYFYKNEQGKIMFLHVWTHIDNDDECKPMNIEESKNKLLELGFKQYDVNTALNCCNNDINIALKYLSENKIYRYFKEHMTMNEVARLSVGNQIDFRCDSGGVLSAVILNKNDTKLTIHYENDGDDHKRDQIIDYTINIWRFADVYSISKCNAFRLRHIKNNDFVAFNPIRLYPKHGWQIAKIVNMDSISGLVACKYLLNNMPYGLWTHKDNINEIQTCSGKLAVDKLISMGYENNAISIALTECKNDVNDAIKYLETNDEKYFPKFPDHMIFEQVDSLLVGCTIDHRHKEGKYLAARIIEKTVNNCNLKIHYEGVSSEHDTWCDYSKELDRFYKVYSVSNRGAHRMHNINVNMSVDGNPKYKNHNGWKHCYVSLKDEYSGQVCISYEWEGKRCNDYAMWVHLDNEQEIAPLGTNIDVVALLELEQYDLIIKVDECKDNVLLYDTKVKECCKWIKQTIYPKKKQESWSTLSKYLIGLHQEFYQVLICGEISRKLENKENTEKLKRIFLKMYSQILDELKTERDNILLDISSDLKVYAISKQGKLSDEMITILQQNKVEWYTKTYVSVEENDCHGSSCPCVDRISFLLQLFNQYFIKKNTNDSSDKLDFIMIWDEAINIDNVYSATQLIDDFEHIIAAHTSEILLQKLEYIIDSCQEQYCIGNRRRREDSSTTGSYFGYTEAHEINVIKLMVKIHMYICHKNIMDPSTNLGRIELIDDHKQNVEQNNENPMNISHNKFVTEINDKTSNKNEINKMPQFGFGAKFYYSNYYKKINHGCYIDKPVHINLKNELLNNKFCALNLSTYNSYFIDAFNHVNTKRARKMLARDAGMDNEFYDVVPKAPIGTVNLLCVLVYTNHTSAQYNFKRFGCRYLNDNDTFNELKKRNANIGHWYQIFYQTIMFYGQKVAPKEIFLHGLSCKLYFSSFNPLFNCPISTTIDVKVARRFATNKGILLILIPNINAIDRYIDVSWCSAYPEEKERLFCFTQTMFIVDIRWNDDSKNIFWSDNHTHYLKGMRLFDFIIFKNCCYPKELLSNKTQQMLIWLLINNKSIMDIFTEFHVNNKLEMMNNWMYEQRIKTFHLRCPNLPWTSGKKVFAKQTLL